MTSYKIPGVLWTGLFIILSMAPAWLEQSFPGAIWLTPVVGAILIIAKVWLVMRPADAPEPPPLPDMLELSAPGAVYTIPDGYALLPVPKPVSLTERVFLG
jgi:hypothetical protein